MGEKVTLPKKVAEALKSFKDESVTNEMILYNHIGNGEESRHEKILGDYAEKHFDEFLSALVNGYEVEKTPEERVKELYDSYCHRGGYDQFRDGVLLGIGKTLDLLGVEVKGVNTE